MQKNKIGYLIFSFFASAALWFYVISVVNPPITETINAIPVQLQGIEGLQSNGMTIAGDGVYTVDVTVKGKRNYVTGITKDDLLATASVSGLTPGQNYIIVSVTAGSNSNITIEDIRSQRIQVYVDELVSVEKPLYVAYTDTEKDKEITILDDNNGVVIVNGAKSLVELVDQVRVDLDSSQLLLDVPVSERLLAVPLDAEGNIAQHVSLESDYISITAVLYNVKTLPLEVNFEGTPGLGASVSEKSFPARINLKAPSDTLNKLTKVVCKTINIEGITEDKMYDLEYNLPGDCFVANSSKMLRGTVRLTHTGTISFTYSADQVELLNGDDALIYTKEMSSVTVTATGELAVVRNLTAKDLQPGLDLEGLAAGEHNVSVELVTNIPGITISTLPGAIKVVVKTRE